MKASGLGSLAWLLFAFVIYLLAKGRFSAWVSLVSKPSQKTSVINPAFANPVSAAGATGVSGATDNPLYANLHTIGSGLVQ